MAFTLIECEQRSPAWFAARLGRVTSSRANAMLTTLKGGGEAAGRRNLRATLMLERLTGVGEARDFHSPAMQQGIDRERDAIGLYEVITGNVVQFTGFLAHPTLMAGASLDGHLGNCEWLVEVKAPLPATHLEYFLTGTIPKDYADQMLHQMYITGAKGCDFVSYNPDFPAKARIKLVSVPRREELIAAHDAALQTFLGEVDAIVAKMTRVLDAEPDDE